MKIRILLADDHQILLDGLKSMLEEETDFVIVDTALNGVEALQKLEKQPVDVLLLDLQMPRMDGIETTVIAKKRFPELKILILTTNDEGSIITEILKKGATGYLLKNTSKQELIRGIRLAHAGKTVLNNQVTTKMVENIRQQAELPKKSKLPKITRREQEVLELIAQEFTAQEIADQLFVSLNTIITHRRNLLVKLDVKNSVGLVRKAMENGII
ncbi:MAG: DNA-binding NarL/FixJ family response regulator [Saprospiraceae bacterium]|jgi:DNA-binding NarL/FixJ family response regulator